MSPQMNMKKKSTMKILHYDPEYDPNRLWCVCRKPHGNKYVHVQAVILGWSILAFLCLIFSITVKLKCMKIKK